MRDIEQLRPGVTEASRSAVSIAMRAKGRATRAGVPLGRPRWTWLSAWLLTRLEIWTRASKVTKKNEDKKDSKARPRNEWRFHVLFSLFGRKMGELDRRTVVTEAATLTTSGKEKQNSGKKPFSPRCQDGGLGIYGDNIGMRVGCQVPCSYDGMGTRGGCSAEGQRQDCTAIIGEHEPSVIEEPASKISQFHAR